MMPRAASAILEVAQLTALAEFHTSRVSLSKLAAKYRSNVNIAARLQAVVQLMTVKHHLLSFLSSAQSAQTALHAVYVRPHSLSSTIEARTILLIAAAPSSPSMAAPAGALEITPSNGGTVRSPAISCAHLHPGQSQLQALQHIHGHIYA